MVTTEPLSQPHDRTSGPARSKAPRPAQPTTEASPEASPRDRFLIVTFLGIWGWIAYKIATGQYYTPRSNFGFYLGVVGALMMVAMLSYPLRKRTRFMQGWGPLKHWFRWHMILGIVGPTLVLFHSTFHLRSLNATIALVSMLIVVASGVIGRFVYTKIHYGLYGRRTTLERVQQEFAGQSDDMKSRFHMAPRVEQWLKSYEQTAGLVEPSFVTMWGHLFVLGWKRRICSFRCSKELRTVLRNERHPEFPGGAPEAIRLARRYLRETERVAEFTAYERIFSLWHILHIPLIFLLAASAIFHVMAVYMY